MLQWRVGLLVLTLSAIASALARFDLLHFGW